MVRYVCYISEIKWMEVCFMHTCVLVGVEIMTARLHAEAWHRRCTVELLIKGKLLSEATKAYAQPHHFERFNYTTAAYCDYCTHLLWGLFKTGQSVFFTCLSPFDHLSQNLGEFYCCEGK